MCCNLHTFRFYHLIIEFHKRTSRYVLIFLQCQCCLRTAEDSLSFPAFLLWLRVTNQYASVKRCASSYFSKRISQRYDLRLQLHFLQCTYADRQLCKATRLQVACNSFFMILCVMHLFWDSHSICISNLQTFYPSYVAHEITDGTPFVVNYMV